MPRALTIPPRLSAAFALPFFPRLLNSEGGLYLNLSLPFYGSRLFSTYVGTRKKSSTPFRYPPAWINERSVPKLGVSFISFGAREIRTLDRYPILLPIDKKIIFPGFSPSQVFAEASLRRRNASLRARIQPTTRRPVIYFQNSFSTDRAGEKTDNKLSRSVWPVLQVLIIQHTPNKWALVPRSIARLSKHDCSILARRCV